MGGGTPAVASAQFLTAVSIQAGARPRRGPASESGTMARKYGILASISRSLSKLAHTYSAGFPVTTRSSI